MEELQGKYGDVKLIPLAAGQEAKIFMHPEKGFDVGNGKGKEIEASVQDTQKRIEQLNKWFAETDIYPKTE